MEFKIQKRISELIGITINILNSDSVKFLFKDKSLNDKLISYYVKIGRPSSCFDEKYPKAKMPDDFFEYAIGSPLDVFHKIARKKNPSSNLRQSGDTLQTHFARDSFEKLHYAKSLLSEETKAKYRQEQKDAYGLPLPSEEFPSYEIITNFKKEYLQKVSSSRGILLEQGLIFDYENDEEPSYKAQERIKIPEIYSRLSRREFESDVWSRFIYDPCCYAKIIGQKQKLGEKLKRTNGKLENDPEELRIFCWGWRWFEEDLNDFSFILPEIFSPRYLPRIHKLIGKVLKKYDPEIYEQSPLFAETQYFSEIDSFWSEFCTLKGGSSDDVDMRGFIGKKLSIIEKELEV